MSKFIGITCFSILIIAIYFASDSERYYNIADYLIKFLPSGNNNVQKNDERLFTSEELKSFNGINNSKLYLALLGIVYDVSKGVNHYGPGKSYNFFVGRDASRSFVTGKFDNENLSDDVADFNSGEFKSLKQWVDFYSREYKEIGKLVGRYFNKQGELTSYGIKIRALIELALQLSSADDAEKRKYPPCNVEWNADSGSRVWCTKRSGGVDRPWIGVPRQLYEVGSKDYRCACIKKSDLSKENIKEYINCPKDSPSCFVTDA